MKVGAHVTVVNNSTLESEHTHKKNLYNDKDFKYITEALHQIHPSTVLFLNICDHKFVKGYHSCVTVLNQRLYIICPYA